MHRRLLLLTMFIVSLIVPDVRAQLVPVLNGGFENYTQTTFEIPDVASTTKGFDCSNYQLIMKTSNFNMTKVKNGLGFAMRLETVAIPMSGYVDTTVGYAIWGGNPQGNSGLLFPGGFPFTDQNVTGLNVDLRYSINPLSKGVIFVQFKKNGVPVGAGNGAPGLYMFQISGSQSTFAPNAFTITPALPSAPDTCVIAFASNDPTSQNKQGYPGDFLEIDNISFTGTTQKVPDGNLDSWVLSPPVDILNNWSFENYSINYKTTDKKNGNYAIALPTIDRGGTPPDNIETTRAYLGSVIYSQNSFNTYIPGVKLTGKPQSIGFYNKYTVATPNIDTASIYVVLTQWDPIAKTRNSIGYVYDTILPKSSYAYKYSTIIYNSPGIPDSAYVEFNSSKRWPTKVAGSLLTIDDVSFNYCGETLTITGSNSVCPNAQAVTYTVQDNPGSTYTWTVPSGASIISGNGTNSIKVNFGSTAGVVQVTKTYQDGCSNSTATLTVGNTANATANAGTTTTICSNATAQLNGTVSGASGGIWSGGSGTFSPNSSTLNATYAPSSSEITNGSVLLTLTTSGNGSCTAGTSQVTINIGAAPTVTGGADQTVCANNNVVSLAASETHATGVKWSGGTGSYSPNNSSLNVSYTPSASEIANGAAILTVTTTGQNAACTPANAQVKINITPAPTVYAGPDQSICGTSTTATLSGSKTIATGVVWSTTGTGTFSSTTALNPTYTLSASEKNGATVKLILMSTGNGLCVAAKDTMLLTISATPTVSAGPDQTTCSNSGAVTLAGTKTNATSSVWSGGNGTFSNASSLTSTYKPSAAEIAAGSVSLTLTTSVNGQCNAATAQMVITITAAPTVSAGADQTVCGTATSASLSGTKTNATGVVWSTTGTGTFSSTTSLAPTYTLSSTEKTGGTYKLIVTTTGTGVCAAAKDTMLLTINAKPTVNAGADQTICSTAGSVTLAGSKTNASGSTWSGGSGTFSPDASTLNGSYTPTASEITTGQVTLTLTSTGTGQCTAVTDQVVISITAPATINAGTDQTICAGSNASLAGTISGATGVKWTTSGTGSFSSTTAATATYTPSSIDNIDGSVTLTVTSTGNGSCSAVTDNMILTIQANPTANAGPDISLCANSVANLSGTVTNSTNGGVWTTSGTGTFSNSSSMTSTYTPSAADQTNGLVTLTLTTSGNGNCTAATDQLKITFSTASSANAGADQTICSGATASLNGTVTGAAGGQWTSAGTGTFDNSNSLTAIYTPSAADLSNGSVVLTLTTTGTGNCSAATDNLTVTFNASSVTVNAGADQTVCSGATISLNGNVIGASGGKWTSSGSGAFTPNDVTLNATYVPSSADMLAGTVTLSLASSGSGSCNPGLDNMDITINTCTGIFTSVKPDYMKLYPTPSNSIVNIEAKAGVKISQITVLNTLQEAVNAQVLEMNDNKAVLDLTDLNAGIYFIRISDGSNIYLEKVIKE